MMDARQDFERGLAFLGQADGGSLAARLGALRSGVAAGGEPGSDMVADAVVVPVHPASGEPLAIARQVADMAQGLAALADQLVVQGQPTTGPGLAEADCIAWLECHFRVRRLRGRHLADVAMGEPAWDILLDLAVAQFWRRETSVTSLCIAADVPGTTALRWINGMTRAGLIVRRACQRDGRRSYLAIAPAAYQAMLALAADSLKAEARVRARYTRAPGN